MEDQKDDAKMEEKSEKETVEQSGDMERVSSRRSTGVAKKSSDVTKSSSHKAKVSKTTALMSFAHTRRQIRSFRRGVKKVWDLWSGFKRRSEPIPPRKVKSPQTSGVPGFEEIACIEVEVPDIMMTDIDKIRTSCKQCVNSPPVFPTKEQVKSKLIAADKYYGVSRSADRQNVIERIDSLEHEGDYYDEDGKIIRPSWRFILERPLVEQYVLMTNYIRKISILSELENPKFDQVVEEEEDLGNDLEYEKFTEKHKIETKNLLDSLRAPKKIDMAVQTTTKSSELLIKAASETSVYPNSGSSNESSHSKESSAVTIVTSHDFSSPLQSDLDSKTLVNSVRVKNAVKWWESKEPPQTSESFPTSCDSAIRSSNQPNITSGSGSDGTSIPVHGAAGKTSLFKLHSAQNDRTLGRVRDVQKHINITHEQTYMDKETSTQKKVTFSPVVKYFNLPEKNNAIFSLPPEDQGNTNTCTTHDLVDTTPKRLERTRDAFENKILLTPSANQKQIILQLGMNDREKNRGFSIIQNNMEEEDSGNAQKHSTRLVFNASNLKTLQGEKSNLTRFDPGQSTSEYRSTSPESFANSSGFRSSPERTLVSRYEQQSREKESSSNSSERIELKPSPAVIFKPGDTQAITDLATDKFYPDVPDIDEVKNNNLYPIHFVDRKDARFSHIATSKILATEKHKLDSSSMNQQFVKLVIVRGTPHHDENYLNKIQTDDQPSNKFIVNPLEFGAMREECNLNRLCTSIKRVHNGVLGSEMNELAHRDNSSQPSHSHQAAIQEICSYRLHGDDLNKNAFVQNDIAYVDTRTNLAEFKQTYFYPTATGRLNSTGPSRELHEMAKNLNSDIFHRVQIENDHKIQSTAVTGHDKLPTGEEQIDLKRETQSVDLQEMNTSVQDKKIMRPENYLKTIPRTNLVSSILNDSRIMRRISEELDFSTTKVCHDEMQIISQERGRDNDFYKFDVLKNSQIYSSSSSFVTPSEEQMASGLRKIEGTVFHPILVEDIIPEVSMMPSRLEDSLSSPDGLTSVKNGIEEFKEVEKDARLSREHIPEIEGDSNKTPLVDECILKTVPLVDECIPQEQTRSVHEIGFSTLSQIQYTQQIEILTPCYMLTDIMQYATPKKVEHLTGEKVIRMLPYLENDEDTKKVIQSNIEYVLQKVHDSTRINDPKNVINADGNYDGSKQWLTNVIPTVIKSSVKSSRRNSTNDKINSGGSSSTFPNPPELKPVFKFLKKQKETQKHGD